MSDTAIYTKGTGRDKLILGIYVDDLILASGSLQSLNSVKSALSEKFKMTDDGEIKIVLGIDVARDREKGVLTLSHERYAQEILKKNQNAGLQA